MVVCFQLFFCSSSVEAGRCWLKSLGLMIVVILGLSLIMGLGIERAVASEPKKVFYFRVREIVVSHKRASVARNPRSPATASRRASRLRRRLMAYAKKEIRERIARFAAYAHKFSDSQTGQNGGVIAVATRLSNLSNSVAEFVCQNPFGSLSPVVESERGFSIYTHEYVEQCPGEILSLESSLSQAQFQAKHSAWIRELWARPAWDSLDIEQELGTVQQHFHGWLAPGLLNDAFNQAFARAKQKRRENFRGEACFIFQDSGQIHFCRLKEAKTILYVEHIVLASRSFDLATEIEERLQRDELSFSAAWERYSRDARRFLVLVPQSSHGLKKLYDRCLELSAGQILRLSLESNSGTHTIHSIHSIHSIRLIRRIS